MSARLRDRSAGGFGGGSGGGWLPREAAGVVVFLTLVASAAAGPPPFTEEASARGLRYTPMQPLPFGEGLAFADLDADGDPDIVLLGAATGRIGLYENDGRGFFTDRSAGIAGVHPLTSGVTAMDFDRDGDVDLHVTRRGLPDRLFRNDGAFHFTDVAGIVGVADIGDGHGAAWADVDGDGWPDLYLCNRDRPNRLFMSIRVGVAEQVVFVDEAVARGVDRGHDPSFAAAFFDMDDDGDPDLYLGNDHGTNCAVFHNHLFRNDGGVFTDVTDQATEACLDAMCVAVGDFDGDGRQDLFSTNTPAGHALMLNRGSRPWLRAEKQAGVAGFAVGWGATFLDFDNDGRLDLHVCHANARNRLFRNTDRWPVEDVSKAVGLDDPAQSFASATADVDGDGDPDLLVGARGVPVRLHINHAGSLRRWIAFDVVGLGDPASVTGRSPEPSIGAVVRVRSGDRVQVREVRAGHGYKSQDELRLLVGLDAAPEAEEVSVRWPGGGETRVLRGLGAGRRWTLWPTDRLGDFDADGDRDPADLAAIAACWTGDVPGALVPGCERADFDGDADVDAEDVLAMLAAGYAGWTGDCDGDGIPDPVAIAAGLVPDLDADGLPDGCPPPPPEDFDLDGRVNAADLAILMSHWGQAAPAIDLDGDGVVGFPDLLGLLAAWTN